MNERFKAIRKHFQKTQKDFGALFGVSRDVVASIENGRVVPDSPYIQLLCLKLDVDANWLLNGTGSMFKEKFFNPVAQTINSNFYTQLGMCLAIVRQNNNLSQSKLALKLGISQSTYAGYETGKRKISLDLLVQISNLLNIPLPFLIAGETSQHRTTIFLTPDEEAHIKKYRILDKRGKKAVDDTLEREAIFSKLN